MEKAEIQSISETLKEIACLEGSSFEEVQRLGFGSSTQIKSSDADTPIVVLMFLPLEGVLGKHHHFPRIYTFCLQLFLGSNFNQPYKFKKKKKKKKWVFFAKSNSNGCCYQGCHPHNC